MPINRVISITDLIESQIEKREPQDAILAYLKTQDGKQLTQRTITKLQELTGDKSIRLRKAFGMTSIEWGSYNATSGREGGSLHCTHTEKNVIIDAKKIEENNARHFSALWRRNELRHKALNDIEAVSELKETIDVYVAARQKLEKLLAYDTVFEPDAYAIRRTFLGEEK